MDSELKPAEQLLWDFGVTDPSEIDVEAIAYAQGLKVRYRKLSGCDALIIGANGRGIITVNSAAAPQRRRFSVAHELGHWHFHRNRITMCVAGDIERGNRRPGVLDDERIADRFASELLMPTYLLKPAVGKITKLELSLVRKMADRFGTSIPATAIRLVEANLVPALLVCTRQGQRAWFVRARDVPERWFPQEHLDPRSAAFELSFGRSASLNATSVNANVWFDRRDAERFNLVEQSWIASNGDALSLLNITDRRMMSS